MIKFVYTISMLLITSVSKASPNIKILCDEKVEEFQIAAYFDSNVPTFRSKITIDPNKPKETVYINSSQVCGRNIGFEENCSGSIKSYKKDIGYQIQCKNGIQGELNLVDSQLTFSCYGPGISDKFQNLIFEGCKLTNLN